jgi:hypothetical protein
MSPNSHVNGGGHLAWSNNRRVPQISSTGRHSADKTRPQKIPRSPTAESHSSQWLTIIAAVHVDLRVPELRTELRGPAEDPRQVSVVATQELFELSFRGESRALEASHQSAAPERPGSPGSCIVGSHRGHS